MRSRGARALPFGLLGLALIGCGAFGGGDGSGAASSAATDRPADCPATEPAPRPLPGVEPEHRTAGYWLSRAAEAYGDPDAVLMDAPAVARHNRALRLAERDGRPLGRADLLAPPDAEAVNASVHERLTYLQEKLATGTYVGPDGEPLPKKAFAAFEPPDEVPLSPSLHRAQTDLALRCGPLEGGFYKPTPDLAFNRNACSTIRKGEPVQVLADWPGEMQLVRSSYALGWVLDDVPLSPRLKGDEAEAAVRPAARPLTRRAVLETAFELLDTSYGWGGHGGGRDCSRYLLDVFERLGVELPRHSGRQARAGTFAVEVSDIESEEEKLRVIEAAARKGVVLLHFPGHIMLYLGRTEDGRPMALHSFSEYLEPCERTEGPDGRPLETLKRVDRVAVSDLELGRGSSRTAFIERITRVVVLGGAPGLELGGVADLRPPAPVEVPEAKACDDSLDSAIFRSPRWPHEGAPLRVIVTSSEDPAPAELVLVDPNGKALRPKAHRLGGPPFTYWAEIEAPPRGRWTAVLGDGDRVVACERFFVHAGPRSEEERAERESPAPAWEPRWRWEEDTENLFSAFVEQLFTEPVDEEVTWSSLQDLLSDPARNLLHDHHGLGEDEALHLEPDCADLPYFLRGYFAWKIGLPFAFRPCSRGRAGQPPMCGDMKTVLDPVDAEDPVRAFDELARRVANTVHSASVRGAPDDDATDLYPVPLTRRALRPGTVFADPYGHLLVVAAWRPQGLGDDYGVLVGADAQPDGTVGRRRFWRGSFLFTPDTTDAGAGFKRWRPLHVEEDEEGERRITALDNAALKRSKEHVPYSREQYRGESADAFYDRMAELINRRPLDPEAVLVSRVDALEESVLRRVDSVDNGEAFMAERNHRPIDMPQGYAIFETRGAWEDFSTPSRDMRLLISIDAVTGFPDAVARAPERFGLEEGDAAETTADALQERLREELEARAFEYTRSDGSTWKLTLADVVDRQQALEVAYNPNDCVEVRWAAPEGSDEHAPCDRRAPQAQRARMAEYRPWFADRRRPPR
ncbi:MAG: NlpC/P60 family protein [Myxococcota bacterium]